MQCRMDFRNPYILTCKHGGHFLFTGIFAGIFCKKCVQIYKKIRVVLCKTDVLYENM